MQFVHVVDERMSNCQCCEGMAKRNEVGISRELVNNHQDAIIAIRAGKTFHEIHGYHLPCSLRNLERL